MCVIITCEICCCVFCSLKLNVGAVFIEKLKPPAGFGGSLESGALGALLSFALNWNSPGDGVACC